MILNTGETWEPEEEDVIQWQRAYQAVDVYQELRAMESWLDANPKKRKTKVGIKRFINSWLSRSQDQGGSSPIAKEYSKNTSGSIKSMTLDMQLTDISWLPLEHREAMKQYYLTQRGFYYDGELKNV